MRRLVDIDLLGDEALQADMAWGSMAILAAGTLGGVLGAVTQPHEEVGPLWFVWLVLASLAALPVHELVHAACFKLLSGFTARVRFGFSNWMLYTSAVGTTMRKGPFCAVLLAPAVLVTSALLVAGIMAGMPLLGWFLSVVHLAGCTGDLGYVRIIVSERSANLVQDTARGIALFYDA